MRRCKSCGELTAHDEALCNYCRYADAGWEEAIDSSRRGPISHSHKLQPAEHQQLSLSSLLPAPPSVAILHTVHLSAFSDSGELGFHLRSIRSILVNEPTRDVRIILNAAGLGYVWDYGGDYDPTSDYYLPPSLPIPSLIEIARFVQVLRQCSAEYEGLQIEVVLPPKRHAATRFIEKAGIIPMGAAIEVHYAQHPIEPSNLPGCDDVLVPLTTVGPETYGQLSKSFHTSFDRLVKAGSVDEQYRSPLRIIVMEAAENADSWGGGRGWVACFLRQENRGAGRWGRRQHAFSPVRDAHLFFHVFSIGPTLSETMGYSSEWEAALAISEGKSTRPMGGGTGMPNILKTVTESALGTVFLSSGNYSRIVAPDGIVREYASRGSAYLPGVHLCALVPLAVVSGILSVAGSMPAM